MGASSRDRAACMRAHDESEGDGARDGTKECVASAATLFSRGPCKALYLPRDVFERVEERSQTMRETVIRSLLGWS